MCSRHSLCVRPVSAPAVQVLGNWQSLSYSQASKRLEKHSTSSESLLTEYLSGRERDMPGEIRINVSSVHDRYHTQGQKEQGQIIHCALLYSSVAIYRFFWAMSAQHSDKKKVNMS